MATTLAAGDIAIVGFNADDPDSFAFVVLRDIEAGTQVNFTDRGWKAAGGFFPPDEGTFTYTATADVPAGTVITVDASAAFGVAFNVDGDQILVYQGTDANPTFIYAADFADSNGTFAGDATSTTTSALPPGLTLGTTAVAIPQDDGAYRGTTTGTQAELLAAISDPANWQVSNTVRQTPPPGPFILTGPPVNTVPDAQSVDEDTALAIGGVTVIDLDSPTLSTTISVEHGTLNVTAGTGATVGGDGTGSVTLAGTAAQINAALAGLTYKGNPDFNGADTLSVATSDGTSTDTDVVAITVNPVPDAPVNTVPGPQTFNEDAPAAALTGLAVVDADSPTLTVTLAVAHGLVAATVLEGTVTGNGTASMTISGTLAQVNATLAAATYQGDPDFSGPDALTITTSDGALTDVDTVAITVAPANDAPVNTVPGPQTAVEDTTLTVSGLTVADTDSATLSTTLTVAHGVLTAAPGSGATITGDHSGSVLIEGTVAQINAALAALSYQGNPDFSGADTLTIATTDGSATDTDTVAITVDPANDAPVLTGIIADADYSIGAPPLKLAADAVLSDADSAFISSVTVSIAEGFTPGDILSANIGSTSASIGGAHITASYDSQAGVLTLSGMDSIENYQKALASIQFQTTASPTGNGSGGSSIGGGDSNSESRTITWVVNDGLDSSVPSVSHIDIQAGGGSPGGTPPDTSGPGSIFSDALAHPTSETALSWHEDPSHPVWIGAFDETAGAIAPSPEIQQSALSSATPQWESQPPAYSSLAHIDWV